jgi:tRNA dimethylallyltransferase
MRSTADSDAEGPPVLILAGPTASGKTGVGIRLAQAIGGEIVSADARQIYIGMDIGTAKPTAEQQRQAPHHLIDVIAPDEDYSAGRFAREATAAIGQIHERGRRAVLVGGSGLYLKALVDGFSPMPPVPGAIREDLKALAAVDLEGLHRRLAEVDPAAADRIHPNDTQRIVRALEVYESSGQRLSDLQTRPPETPCPWKARWFGLNPPRPELYARIDRRVDEMLGAGLVDEVRELRKAGFGPELNALKTFGYREIFDYLNGAASLASAAADIKQATRRYAKRQFTWFRRERRMAWLDPGEGDAAAVILKMLDTTGPTR